MIVETGADGSFEIGVTETRPTIGITDYSRRVTDDFGVTTVVERGFSRRMSLRVALPFEDVDQLQRRLAGLRATPARWVADARFAWLSSRGFYKDFSIDLATAPISYCTLTIEGLAETEVLADPGGDPAPDGQPSTLQLLQPVDVAGAVLTASNVAEDDAPEWSATVIYPSGAQVMKASAHRIYESVIAGNLGDDPAGATGKWVDAGPTNRWAMFDQALGTGTAAASPISVTLNAGAVDAVALLDLTAATVRVQTTGYDRTIAATGGAITFLDLPGAAAPVTVTIAGSGQLSVGTLLIGKLVPLGITEASPTAGITDYSRKVVDDFGAVTVVQRAWAKRMTAAALIRTDAVDVVANRIAAVRARPSLWIGQAGLDSLTVYGFFKDFSIEVGENVSKLSLSIEGLSTAAKVAPLKTSTDWPDIGDPDGTKPDDNATNGADPASPLGPNGTVGSALDVLDINTDSILAEALRQDQLLQVFDARTLVDGQPVGTVFLSFRDSIEEGQTAGASTLALLGAKNANGTAFILDLNAVRVSPTQTLGQKLTEVGAVGDGVTAAVTSLQEAFIGDGQSYAKAVLRAEADGVFGAFSVMADGITRRSTIAMVASEIRFLSTNRASTVNPFSIIGNSVYATNFTADTITYGALVQRFTDVGRQNLDPNGWYQELPGGLIMQGGRYRGFINNEVTIGVTFPKPFPNQVLAVGAMPFLLAFSDRRDLWMQNIGEPTTTGAVFATQAATNDDQRLDGYDWWAWGR
jgi:hypothetical protein